MASLTIRKLDDAIRDELRLRAARNGRSVEDEVRVILREASQHRAPPAPVVAQAPAPAPRGHGKTAPQLPSVTPSRVIFSMFSSTATARDAIAGRLAATRPSSPAPDIAP